MQVLIVSATPSQSSLNAAIAKRAAVAAHAAGAQVIHHDLYQEAFPAVLPAAEIPKNGKVDPIIAGHCSDLLASEVIVIVHPDWWGQPPAILKGWVDRVIRAGVAYEAEGEPGELGVVRGLLTGRSVVVFTTGDTDEEREHEYFRDPLDTLWKRCVFGFCGIPEESILRRHFSIVMTSTHEERADWLDEVDTIVGRVIESR